MNTLAQRSHPLYAADPAAGGTPPAELTPVVASQVDAPSVADPALVAEPQAPTHAKATRSDEEYQREIKALRQEAAAARIKAKELDDLKAKLEADKLTKEEAQAKRIADLERAQADALTAHQERTVRYEVQLAAGKLGIVDADAAVRLLDLSELTFADDGTPTNANEVLKALIVARPWLAPPAPVAAQPAAPNPGATNPSRAAAGNNAPLTITADQYLDAGYAKAYKTQNGISVFQAVSSGKVKVVN